MSLFIVRELYDQTVARLAALASQAGGSPLRSYFGAKKLKAPAELVPNCYLWVPLKEMPEGTSTDPTPEGWRCYWTTKQHFQVRCYGENHVIAQTMLRNVQAVLRGTLGANVENVGSVWSDAVDGEEQPQDGVLLIGELARADVAIARYVHVDPRVMDTPQAPVVGLAPTTQPTSFELRFYTSPDGTTDGELLAVDTVPVP